MLEIDQKQENDGQAEGSRKEVLRVWKSEMKSRDIQHKPIAGNKCRSTNNMVIFSQYFSLKINMASFQEARYNQEGSNFTNKHEQRSAPQARRNEEHGSFQP